MHLMIVLALIHNWHIQSIDFVLAFPQAPIKMDLYMLPPTVPPNFNIPNLPSTSDQLSKVLLPHQKSLRPQRCQKNMVRIFAHWSPCPQMESIFSTGWI